MSIGHLSPTNGVNVYLLSNELLPQTFCPNFNPILPLSQVFFRRKNCWREEKKVLEEIKEEVQSYPFSLCMIEQGIKISKDKV